MGAFGERMRRQREMRSISLDEISESTKISKRFLSALEDEKFERLPGGIFNKGFVRSYARFLGIDEEEAVADFVVAENAFLKASGKDPEAMAEAFPLEIYEKEPDKESSKSSNLGLTIAIAVLIVIGGIAAWMYWQRTQGGQSNEVLASAPEQNAQGSSGPLADAQDQDDSSGRLSGPGASAIETSAGARPELHGTADGPAATQTNSGPLRLQVKARQKAWVSITADGNLVYEGVLAPEALRTARANGELTFKTGNAAGVELSYNGKSVGQLGAENQVKTLTFTPEGIRQ